MKRLLKKYVPYPLLLAGWQVLHLRSTLRERAARNPKTPPEERRIFDLLKDNFDVVFDVGARNELSFYKMKKNCSYHLFEPNAAFVKQLTKQVRRIKHHDIHINAFGLSDVNADNCIYYKKSQSFVVNPTFQHGDIDTGLRYSIRTLDSYVKEHHISKIDFLKIDAEGSDYKIILGGLGMIKNDRVAFIQFEYWDGLQKFAEILKNFDLYIMMEPVLLRAIEETITPLMTEQQKQINFHKSLIPVNQTMIDLIDKIIIPTGNGANVLGVNKKVRGLDWQKLIFDV